MPGLKGVGRPLQGPEAVIEENIEGDEDDEAEGRSQRSGVRIDAPTSWAHTQPHLEGTPRLLSLQRRKLRLREEERHAKSGFKPRPVQCPHP